jgi:hypothetical protein
MVSSTIEIESKDRSLNLRIYVEISWRRIRSGEGDEEWVRYRGSRYTQFSPLESIHWHAPQLPRQSMFFWCCKGVSRVVVPRMHRLSNAAGINAFSKYSFLINQPFYDHACTFHSPLKLEFLNCDAAIKPALRWSKRLTEIGLSNHWSARRIFETVSSSILLYSEAK